MSKRIYLKHPNLIRNAKHTGDDIKNYGVIPEWVVRSLVLYGNTSISRSRYTLEFQNDLKSFFKETTKYKVTPSKNNYYHLIIEVVNG